MIINKLLLIFTFVILSATVDPAIDKIYYYSAVLDENGAVQIDYDGYEHSFEGEPVQKSKNIDSFPVLVDGKTVDDTDFLHIAKTEGIFNALKTTTHLTDLENNCMPVSGLREDTVYSFYGYTVKAVAGADIAPSITQLIKSGPIIYESDIPVEDHCDRQYNPRLLQFSLHKNGVVDSTCIPNTAIPEDATKCKDTQTKYKSYLRGYKEGYFYNVDANTVKNLLLRFGVVQMDVNHEIFIGWQGENWTIASPDSYGDCTWNTQEPIDLDSQAQYNGTVLFNLENYTEDEDEEQEQQQGGSSEDEGKKGFIGWLNKNWKLIAFIAICVVGGYIIIATIVTIIFCCQKHRQSKSGKLEQEILLKQSGSEGNGLFNENQNMM